MTIDDVMVEALERLQDAPHLVMDVLSGVEDGDSPAALAVDAALARRYLLAFLADSMDRIQQRRREE